MIGLGESVDDAGGVEDRAGHGILHSVGYRGRAGMGRANTVAFQGYTNMSLAADDDVGCTLEDPVVMFHALQRLQGGARGQTDGALLKVFGLCAGRVMVTVGFEHHATLELILVGPLQFEPGYAR